MPKVSIIVPIYIVNDDYLHKCIESLINQTLEDIEIILVSDGAPANCIEICKQYQKKDSRIKIIFQENQGVSSARNNGIKAATGKWILFVDADDWVENNLCEFACDKAELDNIDILIFGCYANYRKREYMISFWNKDIISFEEKEKENLQLQMFNVKKVHLPIINVSGTIWHNLYKKDFLINNKIYFNENLQISEDVNFNLLAYEYANKLKYYNCYYYHYRMNVNSACNKYRKNIVLDLHNTLNEYEKFILKYHKNDNNFIQGYYIKSISYIPLYLKAYYFNKENKNLLYKTFKEIHFLFNSEPYLTALKSVKNTELNFKMKLLKFLAKNKLVFLLWIVYKTKNSIRFLQGRQNY